MDECRSGKVGYPTAKQARQTAVSIKQRGRVHRGANWAPGMLGTYRCPMCGQWHVGHAIRAKPQPRPRVRLHLIDEDADA